MRTAVRWLLVLVAVALIISLVIWARGDAHRHGQQVGSIGPLTQVA